MKYNNIEINQYDKTNYINSNNVILCTDYFYDIENQYNLIVSTYPKDVRSNIKRLNIKRLNSDLPNLKVYWDSSLQEFCCEVDITSSKTISLEGLEEEIKNLTYAKNVLIAVKEFLIKNNLKQLKEE